jgi:hypothetical protein
MRDFTREEISNTMAKNPILKAKAGRLIPLFGIVGNVYSIGANISKVIEVKRVIIY